MLQEGLAAANPRQGVHIGEGGGKTTGGLAGLTPRPPYGPPLCRGTGYGCRRPDCGLRCNDGAAGLTLGQWRLVGGQRGMRRKERALVRGWRSLYAEAVAGRYVARWRVSPCEEQLWIHSTLW